MTSRLLRTLLETAEDFATIGLIDAQTMREFNAVCSPPVKDYTAQEAAESGRAQGVGIAGPISCSGPKYR